MTTFDYRMTNNDYHILELETWNLIDGNKRTNKTSPED
jgi:hypothetical protein